MFNNTAIGCVIMNKKQEELFQMLDWNNSKKVQNKGIKLGLNIKDIRIFIMPTYGFSVWDNCARILYHKTDEELKLYLFDLFKWLEDTNWPGAVMIAKRLSMFNDKKYFENIRRKCLELARKENNFNWEMYLKTYKAYGDDLNTHSDLKGVNLQINDTFYLKIDNELYPEYNGKYLIFNFIENTRNKKSDRLFFRVKITDSIPDSISGKDINGMEYIKIARHLEDNINNEDKETFEYQLELVNTNDLQKFLDSLNYLGNYNLLPPEDEYIPKDYYYCFANCIFDIVLDSYYMYNK